MEYAATPAFATILGSKSIVAFPTEEERLVHEGYNHDDGLATWAVARWLLDQDAALPAPTGGATTTRGSEISRVIPSPASSSGSASA